MVHSKLKGESMIIMLMSTTFNNVNISSYFHEAKLGYVENNLRLSLCQMEVNDEVLFFGTLIMG